MAGLLTFNDGALLNEVMDFSWLKSKDDGVFTSIEGGDSARGTGAGTSSITISSRTAGDLARGVGASNRATGASTITSPTLETCGIPKLTFPNLLSLSPKKRSDFRDSSSDSISATDSSQSSPSSASERASAEMKRKEK